MADPNTNAVKTNKRSDNESVYRLSKKPYRASEERQNENAKIVIRTMDVTKTSLKKAAMEVIGVTINAENA